MQCPFCRAVTLSAAKHAKPVFEDSLKKKKTKLKECGKKAVIMSVNSLVIKAIRFKFS